MRFASQAQAHFESVEVQQEQVARPEHEHAQLVYLASLVCYIYLASFVCVSVEQCLEMRCVDVLHARHLLCIHVLCCCLHAKSNASFASGGSIRGEFGFQNLDCALITQRIHFHSCLLNANDTQSTCAQAGARDARTTPKYRATSRAGGKGRIERASDGSSRLYLPEPRIADCFSVQVYRRMEQEGTSFVRDGTAPRRARD